MVQMLANTTLTSMDVRGIRESKKGATRGQMRREGSLWAGTVYTRKIK